MIQLEANEITFKKAFLVDRNTLRGGSVGKNPPTFHVPSVMVCPVSSKLIE